MRYLITVRDESGERTYDAIGNRDALMDAAYDAGALGVSIRRA
ncbi:hypothetical protein NX774_12045 [Massilia agilis]|uniref:Uncharacterized protein n=1 Tax=Massilia agilis TaxID=1811226 RepID=A0ABT2DBG1_9BURK|nr:hypothetical protein [Massilia agilis]MCS0808651.1 hypothetical protein [Massilia agilis]